jgi:hypothetical protein
MLVNKLNDRAEENCISFTTTCRRIYQPAVAIMQLLPGLFLKGKCLHFIQQKPIADNFVSCAFFQSTQFWLCINSGFINDNVKQFFQFNIFCKEQVIMF